MKTRKNRQSLKPNALSNRSLASSLRKLGLESLEERQLLSASTLLEASAIAELTSNAAIVAEANGVAPIDLSNAVADETTLVVTTLEDAVAEDEFLSLREAVQIANNDSANQYTITFDSSLKGGTITLNYNARGSAIAISQGMTIDATALVDDSVPDCGAATPGITISGVYGTGNNDKSNYLFSFDVNSEALKSASTVVTFKGISLTGARVGALNAENASLQFTLNVENSVISDNAGRGLYLLGGGETNLTHVTMENNVASASGLVRYAGGAGFIANGTANITDSVIANNKALTSNSNYASYGGALYVERASVTIENTNVTNNTATATASTYTKGGAIYVNEGELVVRDSAFLGNATGTYRNSSGGAISTSNPSKLDVENSVFEDNESLSGAAIDSLYGAAVNISQSTFSGNTSGATDGSILFLGAANLTNVSVKNNVAPRAITFTRSSGTYYSTISNSVINHAGDVAVWGGNSIVLTIQGTAIRNSRGAAVQEGTNNGVGTLKLVNSLVADSAVGILVANDNHQTVDVVNTDIVGNGTGVKATGGTRGGSVNLKNSIVAMNGTDVEIGNCTVDAHNTLSSFTDWHNAASGAVNYVHAVGDPLFVNATNGDYTLASGSVAIDAGNNSYIQDYATDFAGDERIVNDVVDLGAFEVQAATVETPSIIVTTTNDVVDPTDGLISLREAVEVYFAYDERTFNAEVDPNGKTITFDLDLVAAMQIYNGEITISDSMAFYGDAGNGDNIALDTQYSSRIFKIADGVDAVTFEKLDFYHGAALNVDSYARGSAYDSTMEAYNGGAIYAGATDVTVKDSLFCMNMGYVGGAIFMNGGTLTVSGSEFSQNSSAYQGGAVAVYATEGATALTIADSDFLSNVSDRAGAIYIRGGVADVSETIFNQNQAKYASGGAITVADATFVATNIAVTTNTAARFGGAIFAGNSNVTITNMETVAFSGNVAQYGGAIYSSKGTLAVEAKLDNNTAAVSGGAIFAGGDLTVAASFENNIAGENGGAVYATAGLDIDGSTFATNEARAAGGAIYATKGDVTITNSSFTENEAQGSGGAIRLAKASSAEIKETTFTSNASTTGTGGAIAVSATPAFLIADGTVTGNIADNSGGAIYATGSELDSVRTTYDNNASGKFGGAIAAVRECMLTIAGCSITNSSALAGGAVYVANHSDEALIAESTISNNTASTYGAGVYSVESLFCAESTEFTSNTAASSGGAIFASQGAVILSDATITGNKSTNGAGGAISASSLRMLALSGPVVTGNSAKNSGGAIYAVQSRVEIQDSTKTQTVFNDNVTQKFGGAIYVSSNELVVTAGDFTGNGAFAGGAVYASNGVVSFDSSIFTANTATEHGGAIFAVGGEADVRATLFSGNKAESDGGAIYFSGVAATLYNGRFKGNESTRGGAVFQSQGASTIQVITFAENAATTVGGAFYQFKGTSTITDVSFEGNEATTKAGAVYVGAGGTTISGSTFTGNTAARGTAISAISATSLEIDGEAFPTSGAIEEEDLSSALLDEAFAELFVEELD